MGCLRGAADPGKQLHQSLCRILKEIQRGDPGVGTEKPTRIKEGCPLPAGLPAAAAAPVAIATTLR